MKNLMDVLKYVTGGLFNIVVSIFLIIAVYTVTVTAFNYGKGLLVEDTSAKTPKEVIVNIADGKDTAKVAELLEEEGLISNKWIFNLQARLNGSYKYFRSGEFRLDMSMSSNEIMETLQSIQYPSEDDQLKITIVEGLTNKQIAAFVESEGLFTAQEFLDACQNGEYDYDFLKGVTRTENRLEGYLFPDTYILPPEPTPDDLITRMLDRFQSVYNSEKRDRAEELGLTTDEIIIMASIIEKEIKLPEEQAVASSVIYNRLKINMPLQMCSTVLYALDKRKDRLLDEDLQVQSPYNTYINGGLPVGAICNPGEGAINAALYPEKTNYIYFVVKDEEIGEHFFTDNDNDFLAAKAQYNQKY